MAAPIIVYPPDQTGGRRVRADSQILGRAHNTADLPDPSASAAPGGALVMPGP